VDFLPFATVYRVDLTIGQITGTTNTTLNFLHSAVIMATPAPRLNVSAQGGQLVLSWSSACTNCVLQTTDRLGPSPPWADSMTPPVPVGGLNVVTNSLLGAQGFFRLIER
jgi:hypothetical protein